MCCAGQGKGASHTFQATDPKVLELLPPCIRLQLPCHLTNNTGLSSIVADMTLIMAARGQSFEDIHTLVSELNHLTFHRKELAWLSSLSCNQPEGSSESTAGSSKDDKAAPAKGKQRSITDFVKPGNGTQEQSNAKGMKSKTGERDMVLVKGIGALNKPCQETLQHMYASSSVSLLLVPSRLSGHAVIAHLLTPSV